MEILSQLFQVSQETLTKFQALTVSPEHIHYFNGYRGDNILIEEGDLRNEDANSFNWTTAGHIIVKEIF